MHKNKFIKFTFSKIVREIIRPYYQFLNFVIKIKRFSGFYDKINVSNTTFRVTPHEFWREYKRESWEPETYANIKKHLSSETTFIDLGAWVGICSMWASEIGCKKIHAVEANPISYKLLQKTINANKSLRELVTLSNKCVSNEDGDIVKFGKKISSNSMISKEGHYEVSTISLRSYINDIGIFNNIFLKIDIEGAEQLILEDLKIVSKSVKNLNIFLAVHPPFWDNKTLTCEKLMSICKGLKMTSPSGDDLCESKLRKMIMTNQDFPNWGTLYGNFFEIMLSNETRK